MKWVETDKFPILYVDIQSKSGRKLIANRVRQYMPHDFRCGDMITHYNVTLILNTDVAWSLHLFRYLQMYLIAPLLPQYLALICALKDIKKANATQLTYINTHYLVTHSNRSCETPITYIPASIYWLSIMFRNC